MSRAKIISVEVTTDGEGLFFATSPQMPELFASGQTEQQAIDRVPEMIEGLYALDGIKVQVLPAESDNLPIPQPWVIVGENAATSC